MWFDAFPYATYFFQRFFELFVNLIQYDTVDWYYTLIFFLFVAVFVKKLLHLFFK